MDLVWVLLFGSLTPITEAPVHLVAGANEVPLRKPVSALTPGATLQVDISALIPRAELSLDSARKWVERNVESGCLIAVLRGKDTTPTVLEFNGGWAFEPGKVFLILASHSGVPIRKEYGSLTLTSCRPFNHVGLYWQNYQK